MGDECNETLELGGYLALEFECAALQYGALAGCQRDYSKRPLAGSSVAIGKSLLAQT